MSFLDPSDSSDCSSDEDGFDVGEIPVSASVASAPEVCCHLPCRVKRSKDASAECLMKDGGSPLLTLDTGSLTCQLRELYAHGNHKRFFELLLEQLLLNIDGGYQLLFYLVTQVRMARAAARRSFIGLALDAALEWIHRLHALHQGAPLMIMQQQKLQVFHQVMQYSSMDLPSAIEVFQLDLVDDKLAMAEVLANICDLEHKQIASAIGFLRLHKFFPGKNILLALLFEARIQSLEALVRGSEEYQSVLLEALEEVANIPQGELHSFAMQFGVRVKDGKLFSLKNLAKMAEKYCNEFNLMFSSYPKLFQEKSLNMLRAHLYIKMVQKNNMTDARWLELAEDYVCHDEVLQTFLVNELVKLGDMNSAWFVRERFSIPLAQLSSPARRTLESYRSPFTEQEAGITQGMSQVLLNDINRQFDFLQLSIPRCNVFIVETAADMDAAGPALLVNGNLIGYDAEFTTKTLVDDERLSIVQLALQDRIFVIDVMKLRENGADQVGADFFHQLFIHPGVSVIGYGMAADFLMLKQVYPSLKGCMESPRVVDLQAVSSKMLDNLAVLKELYPVSPLDYRQPDFRGLGHVVLRCLGKPLSKIQQCSNWARRPLSEEQIHYAALDAHCLLAVHRRLKEVASKLGLRDVLAALTNNPRSSSLASLSSPTKLSAVRIVGVEPVQFSGSDQLSLICDEMLRGLCSYLRLIGIDTVQFCPQDRRQPSESILRIATRDRRIILTCRADLGFFSFSADHVNRVSVVVFPPGLTSVQAAAIFFARIGLRPHLEYVGTRCRDCNSTELIELSGEDVREAWGRFGKVRHLRHIWYRSSDDSVFVNKVTGAVSPINFESLAIAENVRLQCRGIPNERLRVLSWVRACTLCGCVLDVADNRARLERDLCQK